MTKILQIRPHTRQSPAPKPNPAQEEMTARLWEETFQPELVRDLSSALADLSREQLERIQESF